MRKIIIPFVALLAAFTACTRTDNKILNDLKKNGRVVLLSDLVDLTDPDRGEDTFTINETLKTLAEEGGGTLVFSGGTFKSRTIKLQSNITLYFDENAVLQAFPGEYSLEDLTDPATGELYDWATKQDAGHTWFCPSLFHGEDLEHVRIIGNGRIDGADVITKYDNLAQDQALVPMNNKTYKPVDSSGQVAMANNALPSPDSRGRTCNKMFALRRCTDVEIGGINPGKDLWYEGEISGKRGRIVYLNEDGSSDYESVGKMLHITDTGHFAILASGVDDLHVHDLYMDNAPNMRDAFNLMSCRDVVVCNIYIEGMSDDLIKFASDCSLGAPRSGGNFIVRNIVGNTDCSLLVAGEESYADIENLCIDNVFNLGSNKSGFMISSGNGAAIRNIHLNCGGSVGKCSLGTDHGHLSIGYEPAAVHPYRSRFTHTRTPFYFSASAPDNGQYDDLPRTVENVYVSKVSCEKIYAGSTAKACMVTEFPEYNGQAATTAMIQGSVPSNSSKHAEDPAYGRIRNVIFEDVDVLVMGGHPESERLNVVSDNVRLIGLRQADTPDGGSILPAYGFYMRRVDGIHFRNCTVSTEQYDGREPFHADDCTDVTYENITILNPAPSDNVHAAVSAAHGR